MLWNFVQFIQNDTVHSYTRLPIYRFAYIWCNEAEPELEILQLKYCFGFVWIQNVHPHTIQPSNFIIFASLSSDTQQTTFTHRNINLPVLFLFFNDLLMHIQILIYYIEALKHWGFNESATEQSVFRIHSQEMVRCSLTWQYRQVFLEFPVCTQIT